MLRVDSPQTDRCNVAPSRANLLTGTSLSRTAIPTTPHGSRLHRPRDGRATAPEGCASVPGRVRPHPDLLQPALSALWVHRPQPAAGQQRDLPHPRDHTASIGCLSARAPGLESCCRSRACCGAPWQPCRRHWRQGSAADWARRRTGLLRARPRRGHRLQPQGLAADGHPGTGR